MIIGVQICDDKPRRTMEVEPGGQWGWIVRLDRRPDKALEINEATLIWMLDTWANKPPDNPQECHMGYSWDCPHFPTPPCLLRHRRTDKKHLAVISCSPYVPELVPVGQMSLDTPHVSHRRHWRHIYIGELLDQAQRPWIDFPPVCRALVMKALKARIEGTVWEGDKPSDPRAKWRVRPFTNYQADHDWLNRLAAKHERDVKPCVFEQGVM